MSLIMWPFLDQLKDNGLLEETAMQVTEAKSPSWTLSSNENFLILGKSENTHTSEL